MRKPLIAGNWKMHFTVPEGLGYALLLRREVEPFTSAVDVVILPPALMLWEIANALRGCPIEVGAQNAGWEDQGPFTGEIQRILRRSGQLLSDDAQRAVGTLGNEARFIVPSAVLKSGLGRRPKRDSSTG